MAEVVKALYNCAFSVWNVLIEIAMTLFTTSPKVAASGTPYATVYTIYNAISDATVPIATVFFLIAIYKSVISAPPGQQAMRFLQDTLRYCMVLYIASNMWTIMGYIMTFADGITTKITATSGYTLTVSGDMDALFGIDALKNQSILQKIVFWGSVLGGVLLNVLLPLYFDVSNLICIFLFLEVLLVGISFGCNYTEDMTYGKYLFYFFFKPTTMLFYESTEDVERIREKSVELKREEELLIRRKQQADPREQRELLVKVIAFVIVLVISMGAVFIYSGMKEKDNLHHKVEMIMEAVDE